MDDFCDYKLLHNVVIQSNGIIRSNRGEIIGRTIERNTYEKLSEDDLLYVVVIKSIWRGIDTVKGIFTTRTAAQHYIEKTKRRFQTRAVISRLEKVT